MSITSSQATARCSSACPKHASRPNEPSIRPGILPASFDAVYESIGLDRREAQLLGQNTGKAALRIIRSTYDKDGKPFEVGTLVSCDSQAKIHIHITPEKTTFNAIAQ